MSELKIGDRVIIEGIISHIDNHDNTVLVLHPISGSIDANSGEINAETWFDKKCIKKVEADEHALQENVSNGENQAKTVNTIRWEVPLFGKENAIVILPNNFDADDWIMLDSVISLYISHSQKHNEKGKGN